MLTERDVRREGGFIGKGKRSVEGSRVWWEKVLECGACSRSVETILVRPSPLQWVKLSFPFSLALS